MRLLGGRTLEGGGGVGDEGFGIRVYGLALEVWHIIVRFLGVGCWLKGHRFPEGSGTNKEASTNSRVIDSSRPQPEILHPPRPLALMLESL